MGLLINKIKNYISPIDEVLKSIKTSPTVSQQKEIDRHLANQNEEQN